ADPVYGAAAAGQPGAPVTGAALRPYGRRPGSGGDRHARGRPRLADYCASGPALTVTPNAGALVSSPSPIHTRTPSPGSRTDLCCRWEGFPAYNWSAVGIPPPGLTGAAQCTCNRGNHVYRDNRSSGTDPQPAAAQR